VLLFLFVGLVRGWGVGVGGGGGWVVVDGDKEDGFYYLEFYCFS